MRRALGVLVLLGLGTGLFVAGFVLGNRETGTGETIEKIIAPVATPYAAYRVESMQNEALGSGPIEIKEVLAEKEGFTSYLFSHEFQPAPYSRERKKVTGLINLPEEGGEYPVALMLRGYVDPEMYWSGVGTRSAGEYFAENGFITVAPDFLGYGGSDPEAGNIFETRFQTYTTALSVLNALGKITTVEGTKPASSWDGKNIVIWAHSNGGQVALTVLAATGARYPTALWAPVTKPFPYSVLYFTDEAEDGGKLIRTELAKLEKVYDLGEFSFTNYLSRIAAPLLLHQGTADDAVPVEWSEGFVQKAEEAGVEIEYRRHAGADHNMKPAWNEAAQEDLEFFRAMIDKTDS